MRAIVIGERDSRKLAELSHPRIQASREEIAKSLEGNWRQELIFVLQLEMYDTYQRRIAECDQQLQTHLRAFSDTVPLPVEEELPPKTLLPGEIGAISLSTAHPVSASCRHCRRT